MTSRSSSAETAVLELPGLPALADYLQSLDERERSAAMGRMAGMADADLYSLGVSEPQHTEYDYDVLDVRGEVPAELNGTLYRLSLIHI